MPITLRIACDRCGRLHLVNAPLVRRRIDAMPPSIGGDMFILKCTACQATRSFHKTELKLCAVSAKAHAMGYAERGEYSLTQSCSGRSATLAVTRDAEPFFRPCFDYAAACAAALKNAKRSLLIFSASVVGIP